MDNGFKTKFVEPNQSSVTAVIDEVPEEKLASQALQDIRDTERLSAFGRFATKMQNLFQASPSGISQSKQQKSSHLKAAPVMMSAGLLLLIAAALLFVVSKPESAVQSHFRQPTGLSGTDSRKSASQSNTETPVTENQLVGTSGINSDAQSVKRDEAAVRERGEGAGSRFSFANQGGVTNPAGSSNVAATSELQNPATVFVANSVTTTAFNPTTSLLASRDSDVQIPSGTEITAHTTNAISSGLESPVIAIVDRNILLGDAIVIPQGARVIGYTAGAVKDRINVRFTSLVLPNHREVAISGLALMKDGSAGLAGKVQGSGRPVLATAGRIATGASVLAIQFAGQNSMNQPFSQADYLRNQLASEVASEGSRYSNRFQQPMTVPIVTVNTNQSIRIFLLNPLPVVDGHARSTNAAPTAEQNQPPEQSLAATQSAYIQALESQLADMRAALDARKSNANH